MKGIIITYAEGINPREITDNNNTIFGKVIKSHQTGRFSYYYYPGILHDKQYVKLANGCYFIFSTIDLRGITDDCKNMVIMNAELFVDKKKLITAEQHFRKKFEGRKVTNLD